MRKVIPYNLNLVEKARENRKNPTPAERHIWNNILKNRQLLCYKFTRQKPLSNFIADFYCSKLLLVIEIDGEYHAFETARDDERTNILNSYNIKVIRFRNDNVLHHLEDVNSKLINIIHRRERELSLIP